MNDEFDDHHEPWPLRLSASLLISLASWCVGMYGAFTTWSLTPLLITAAGLVVAGTLAASVISWRGAWQKMRERRRIEAAFAEIAKQEARR